MAIANLKIDAARAAAEESAAQTPGEAMAVEMDVTDEDTVNAGMQKVADTYGRFDVLISNAGMQILRKAEGFPSGEWKKLLSIHLGGAFLASKAVIPHMKAQGGGAILFMRSVHSKETSALKAPYVTASSASPASSPRKAAGTASAPT
nr:SDR family NAD(P)-dependent oxidoreductase [Mangrovicoccus ximenensis]